MPTTETNEVRNHVKNVYSSAATEKAGLCCPKPMPSDLIRHIPEKAFDHNYGCGTPVVKAGLKPGQIVVDLGSGVGIDCFVAAKIVGAEGRVIGIDMTDDMLGQAFMFNNGVSKNLGYDVVEFRKGLLERLPLADNSVDVVMSNCVINLSTQKDLVFKEIFRVLKVGGRLVLSDIVSDREISPADQASKQEWAECVTGSMSLGGLLGAVEKAGFVGMHQLDEAGWQTIRGYNFSTLTIEATKYVSDCDAQVSSLAIYLGPYAKVVDDMGNEYVRFRPVAIRDDVAALLKVGPNADSFIVVKGRAKAKAPAAKAPAPQQQARRSSPCCDPTEKAAPCCDNNEPKADGSPCCDTMAVEQSSSCNNDGSPCGTSCGPTVTAAPEVVSTSSSCGPSGCGPSGCGPSPAASSGSSASKTSTNEMGIKAAPVSSAPSPGYEMSDCGCETPTGTTCCEGEECGGCG